MVLCIELQHNSGNAIYVV